jgi:hypothetical protein
VFASGQFWNTVFGDGRTYIDAFLMAVIMLLATPSRRTAEAPATTRLWVFASNRIVTNKYLGWLTAVAVIALIVVARRRILFE